MKNFLFIAITSILLISCVGNDKYVLKDSIGSLNKVMVVAKVSDWTGDIGQEIRTSFGELMIGLPQPEPILTLSQVAPSGFSAMMKAHRNLLIVSESDNEGFSVKKNVLDNISVLKLSVEEGYLDGTIRYELNRNKVECYVVKAESDLRTIRFVYLKSKNMFEMVSLESFQENYKNKIDELCWDSNWYSLKFSKLM